MCKLGKAYTLLCSPASPALISARDSGEQSCDLGREGGREAEAKLNLQRGNFSELNVKELEKD